jgi:aromatic ring hydroxylase
LDEGAAVLSRLTNASAFFVQTDAPEGMKMMMRRKLEKTMEGDFETDSMRYKATERYDVGFTDPRAMYGTPGV